MTVTYGNAPVGDESGLVTFVSQLMTDNGGSALTTHQNALLRFVCRGVTDLLDAHPFTVLFSPLKGIDLSIPFYESQIAAMLSPGLSAAGWVIPNPPTPNDIFVSVPLLQWCRADTAVTLSGSAVTAWGDRSATGNVYISPSILQSPTYSKSDATLSRLPSITFDGVSSRLTDSSLNLSNPFFLLLVAKINQWTSPKSLVGQASGATSGALIMNTGGSPNVNANSGSGGPANAGSGLGVWERYWGNFTGSTSDYLRRGPTTVTGNFGTNSSSGRQIGCQANGNFSNISVWEIAYLNGTPTNAELTAYDGYVAAYTPTVSL